MGMARDASCATIANSHLSRLVALLIAGLAASPAYAGSAPDPVDTCRAWLETRSWDDHASDPEALILTDRAACFDGMIERGSLDDLRAWLDRAQGDGDERPTLIIRSGGGDADEALALAEKLQAGDASVYVADICASSCANFLYAGLRRRHVFDGALVLFHGGFSKETRARAMASLDALLAGPQGALIEDHEANRRAARESYDTAMARQDALFRKAGADPAVVHGVDAIDFGGIDDRRCGGPSDLPRDFVFFDLDQMERLGIAPLSGKPAADPEQVNAAIAAYDRNFIACKAPEDILSMRGR